MPDFDSLVIGFKRAMNILKGSPSTRGLNPSLLNDPAEKNLYQSFLETKAKIEPHLTLLQLLRDKLELMGTKEGCGMGECGACTVILNGKTVNSCIFPAIEADGKNVMTIEGLTDAQGNLHPIQKAFVEYGAVQCGFCTPGMVLSAKALLEVRIQNRQRRRFEAGLPETYVVVPVTSKSSRPSKRRAVNHS